MQLWLDASPPDGELEELSIIERAEEHRALDSLFDGLRRQASRPSTSVSTTALGLLWPAPCRASSACATLLRALLLLRASSWRRFLARFFAVERFFGALRCASSGCASSGGALLRGVLRRFFVACAFLRATFFGLRASSSLVRFFGAPRFFVVRASWCAALLRGAPRFLASRSSRPLLLRGSLLLRSRLLLRGGLLLRRSLLLGAAFFLGVGLLLRGRLLPLDRVGLLLGGRLLRAAPRRPSSSPQPSSWQRRFFFSSAWRLASAFLILSSSAFFLASAFFRSASACRRAASAFFLTSAFLRAASLRASACARASSRRSIVLASTRLRVFFGFLLFLVLVRLLDGKLLRRNEGTPRRRPARLDAGQRQMPGLLCGLVGSPHGLGLTEVLGHRRRGRASSRASRRPFRGLEGSWYG